MIKLLPSWIPGRFYEILMYFLLPYAISVHPWIRRWIKKVSFEQQVRFAFIVVFIVAGMKIDSLFSIFLIQKYWQIYDFVYGTALVVTGILVLKKSKYAFRVTIGVAILHISMLIYLFIYRYFKLGFGLLDHPIELIGAYAINTIVVFSPLARGLLAIRDLKREEENISESI